MTSQPKAKRVFAVSSGGGHWIQLKRILPSFEGHRLWIVGVHPGAVEGIQCEGFFQIKDASMWSKGQLLMTSLRVLWLMLRHRPDVVVSTGAAPGFFALMFGKLVGARTIWIDSIANAGELSLSGQKAGRFADLWLTQWPDLAREGGPHYKGSVL